MQASSGAAAPTQPPASVVRAAATQRAHRAAVAQNLAARAPTEALTLDWQALTQAPAWLALPEGSLNVLRRRVGSVLLAPALRLWISASRINAAREAVGEAWWSQLLSHEAWPSWPTEAGDWPSGASSSPDAVATVFDEVGAAVLLATLPHGALRHVALQAFAPVADVILPQAQAQAVLSITLALIERDAAASQASPATEPAAPSQASSEAKGPPVGATDPSSEVA